MGILKRAKNKGGSQKYVVPGLFADAQQVNIQNAPEEEKKEFIGQAQVNQSFGAQVIVEENAEQNFESESVSESGSEEQEPQIIEQYHADDQQVQAVEQAQAVVEVLIEQEVNRANEQYVETLEDEIDDLMEAAHCMSDEEDEVRRGSLNQESSVRQSDVSRSLFKLAKQKGVPVTFQ